MQQNSAEIHALENIQQAIPITTRRMFGCIGVYADETFFAIVKDQHAYFKADAHNRPAYEAHGVGPFVPNGRQRTSFYRVPDNVLDAPDVLHMWTKDAIAAAQRQKK